MKSLEEVKKIKRNAERELLSIPGVNGVGIGYKEVGGQTTDEMSIHVYVNKKRQNVSDSEVIPSEINGIKTDVIEREATAKAHSCDNCDLDIYNPIRGGIAIGRITGDAGGIEVGTVGAIVKDNQSNEIGLLSSFHVLGVNFAFQKGDAISQPAGNSANIVAHLSSHVSLGATIDAAVATLDNPSNILSKIEGIDGSITGIADAVPGMHVKKRGIKTRLTEGTIKSISTFIDMDYGHGIPNGWRLSDQVVIVPDSSYPAFSEGGDSGSAIVDDSGKVVGLLVGGGTYNGGPGSYANRIQNVLSDPVFQGISIYTG